MKHVYVLFYTLYLFIPTKCLNVIDSFDGEEDDFLRIPLVRQKSGIHRFLELATDLKLFDGLKDIGKLKRFAPSNDTVSLFKYYDSEYYGLINIGKPGKQFKMIFDTVWSHSWVPSVECPRIKLPCAIHNRYDHRTSSTYKPDNTPFNISGKFVGYLSKDVFLVGQMNSTDQQFVEISRLPWMYSLVHADGVVGLALGGASPGYTPFFFNFVQQNHLKNAVFSFYINRDPTTEHGGTILLGGINKKHQKGEFTTVALTSTNYWTFKMSKVALVISSKSKIEYCINGCTATADTSSNSIVGPPNDIKDINVRIGAEPFIFNRYLIPCAMEYKGPKVNFTIGNRNFQILGRDYVQKLSYSGFTVCLSAFEQADAASLSVSDWRLGGAFLYQFYTVFDLQNERFMIADAA